MQYCGIYKHNYHRYAIKTEKHKDKYSQTQRAPTKQSINLTTRSYSPSLWQLSSSLIASFQDIQKLESWIAAAEERSGTSKMEVYDSERGRKGVIRSGHWLEVLASESRDLSRSDSYDPVKRLAAHQNPKGTLHLCPHLSVCRCAVLE